MTMLVFTLGLVSWRDYTVYTLSLSLSEQEINNPGGLEAASRTPSWRCVRGRGWLASWEQLTCEEVEALQVSTPGQHVLRRDTGASSASSEVGGERTYGHTQLHKH